ncbi:MAG: hypothetical protein EZS28_045901, partial [Streblomastix strix]
PAKQNWYQERTNEEGEGSCKNTERQNIEVENIGITNKAENKGRIGSIEIRVNQSWNQIID